MESNAGGTEWVENAGYEAHVAKYVKPFLGEVSQAAPSLHLASSTHLAPQA
jgi:hypothetical protein